MTNSSLDSDEKVFQGRVLAAAIRIGLVVLFAFWSFKIFQPFIIPVVWGIVIAVAIHPLYEKLLAVLNDRHGIAGTLVVLLGLILLIVPIVLLSDTLVDGTKLLADGLKKGTLYVPPPPESIESWPVVGPHLNTIWSLASHNLEEALSQIEPLLIDLGSWLLSAGAGAGLEILQLMIAIIIAGVLLAHASRGHNTVRKIAVRVTGPRGGELANLATATIRSVAQGVLGIALIQSILAGIGFLLVGVPGAGIWAVLVLFLAVIQLPPLLIIGPIIVYVFATSDTLTAVVFMIWGIFVSVGDAFLKPLLLGRGVEIPMPVILIGAIGGVISSGIIGLFVGAVVLALSYKLFLAWLNEETELNQVDSESEKPVAKDTT
ncbi:MAG: AI-2E family transporter [Nitrospirota bacterium]|nr:MAG: AI-2E family transporter [Nitrospirota bacterium]